MAKAGFWLRGSKGKLAGASMQKGANGDTIIREVVTPKNPQTEAQMLQRIIVATVGQAYSKMKDIVDHSFEGITAGALTMQKFQAYNLNVLRQHLATEVEQGYDLGSIYAFSPLGTKAFSPNAYIISQGSLPEVPVVVNEAGLTTAKIAGLAANTYQAVIDAFGLRRGDQLTFVTVQGGGPNNTEFHFARIILDPTDAQGNPAPLSSAFIGASNAVNLPSKRNEGTFATLTYADGNVTFGFSAQNLTAAGIIVSRKNGDNWLRSNCQLATNDSRVAGYFYSMQQCLDMFSEGAVATLSNRMLNNAGTGAVALNGVSNDFITCYTMDSESPVLVELIGVRENGGALVGVDRNGNEYFLKAGNVRMLSYGKYFTGFDTSSATAPEGSTTANTVTLPRAEEEDIDYAGGNWLIRHGVSSEVIF